MDLRVIQHKRQRQKPATECPDAQTGRRAAGGIAKARTPNTMVMGCCRNFSGVLLKSECQLGLMRRKAGYCGIFRRIVGLLGI